MRWIVEFDSHKEKKGDIFEGDELPLYLHGKAKKMASAGNKDREFEVNTPQKESQRQPK